MNCVSRLVVVFSLVILLAACQNPSSNIPQDNGPSIETVYYQNDNNGYIQYKTNDSHWYGWTHWYSYSSTEQVVMNTLEVEYVKKSGSYYPSGVVFNHQNDTNFRHLQITTGGYYSIVEKVNNVNTTIVDWTLSDAVIQGLDVSNIIRIEYDEVEENLYFYINDSLIEVLHISSFSSNHINGKSGFIVAVGPSTLESFPTTPVDFRYKMLQPINIPSQ